MFQLVNKWLEKDFPTDKTHGDIAVSTGSAPYFFNKTDQFDTNSSDLLTRTYELLSMVYRCINIRANNIASLPVRVVQITSDGKEVDVSQRDQLSVLTDPNTFQTRHDFYFESSMRLDTQGELFWVLDITEGGQIAAMYADWLSNNVEVVGDPQSLYRAFIYRANGHEKTYDPSQVFYQKYVNPFNILRGLPPLKAAASNLALQLNTETYLKKFFNSGMAPGGVLSSEKSIEDTQRKRLRKEIEDNYGGIENMHRFLLLGSGLEYTPLSRMTLVESDVLNLIKLNEKAICDIFGIPLEVAGVIEATFSNRREAIRALWEQTLIPHNNCILERINKQLVPRLTRLDNVEMKFDYSVVTALKDDMDSMSKIFDLGYKNGAITPNEIRQTVFGLEPKPNADMDLTIVERGVPAPGSSTLPVERSLKKKELTEELDRIWEKQIAVVDRHAEKIESLMVGFFSRQADEVERVLGTAERALVEAREKQQFDIIGLVFDFERWKEELADEVEPLFAAAVIEAASEWVEGAAFDVTAPNVEFALGQRVRTFSEFVNSTTDREIQKYLQEGFLAGDDIPGLTNRILNNVFDPSLTRSRAELIGRTEAMGANNFGIQKGLEQGGFEFKQWITSRDERVRCSHKIDGQIVPVTSMFELASGCDDGDNGAQWEFPQGFNERCTMRGVRTANG